MGYQRDGADLMGAVQQALLMAGAAADTFPSGVVSYWPFEEGSGTNTEDTVGANDGTLVNSPAWSTDEKIGTYGLDFSGATNRAVTIPVSHDMSSQDMSFGVWAKRTGTNDNRVAFSWVQASQYLLLIHRTDTAGLTLQVSDGGAATFINTGVAMTVGTYYLIGFTKSGTTYTVRIDSSTAVASYTFSAGSSGFTIGNYAGILAMDGILDEAFYFTRALSGPEWAAIYNAGAGRRP